MVGSRVGASLVLVVVGSLVGARLALVVAGGLDGASVVRVLVAFEVVDSLLNQACY